MSIAVNASALSKERKTGVEWYAVQILKSLHSIWEKNDPEVILFAPKVEDETLRFFSKSNWRFKFIRSGLFWTQRKLKFSLDKVRPKLLFSPSYVAPLLLNKNILTLNVVHGLEGEYFPEQTKIREILEERLLVRSALRKSNRIVAVSSHTKDDLIKFYNFNPEKIKIIKSGPGTFLDEDMNSLLGQTSSLKSEKRIDFVFLGGSFERKNLYLALQIFSLISEKTNIPIKLYIVGSLGKKDAEIEKLIAKLGSRIQNLGYLEEEKKRDLLKTSHFLLYPSFYEGFGFPILEAQLNSVIPIVLQAKNFKEIGGGNLVELIDSRSGNLNVENILSLVKNPEKREALIRSGQANAKKYSWQKCAEEMRRELIGLHDGN